MLAIENGMPILPPAKRLGFFTLRHLIGEIDSMAA